jgi:predicted transcriptional regulator
MTRDSILETMVERVSWMSPIDYRILEFFEDYDIQVSPKVLSENIDYERKYTGRRLKTLKSAGLVVQNENGLYELSDRGRAFIAGDLDADELDAPDGEESGD